MHRNDALRFGVESEPQLYHDCGRGSGQAKVRRKDGVRGVSTLIVVIGDEGRRRYESLDGGKTRGGE